MVILYTIGSILNNVEKLIFEIIARYVIKYYRQKYANK